MRTLLVREPGDLAADQQPCDCVLQVVQQAAADHDLLFPRSLASEGSCTIGGNLATNAGGTRVLRYRLRRTSNGRL